MNTYKLLDKHGEVLSETQFDSDREAMKWSAEAVSDMKGTIILARVYPWGGCVKLMAYRRP